MSMLYAMAVMAVPAVGPWWRVAPDRSDIETSDPRPFCSLAKECLSCCPRNGVKSSISDMLNSWLLRLDGFADSLPVPGSLESLKFLISHCLYSAS